MACHFYGPEVLRLFPYKLLALPFYSSQGLFAYTSGCLVVIEDLHSGTQRHLMGHTEEVSTLALQHDGLVLASASGPSDTSPSQICLWNLKDGICKKVYRKFSFQRRFFTLPRV